MTYHFERAARIRFAHCDPAGIVYFPQYLVLFNGLVEDWFTDGLGVSYAQMLGPRRIGLPIVKLHCEFSAVSRMGDEVLVLGVAPGRVTPLCTLDALDLPTAGDAPASAAGGADFQAWLKQTLERRPR